MREDAHARHEVGWAQELFELVCKGYGCVEELTMSHYMQTYVLYVVLLYAILFQVVPHCQVVVPFSRVTEPYLSLAFTNWTQIYR